MKALIVTAIFISGLIVSCSDPFTSHLSLNENNDEQIEDKLLDYKKEEATGVGVTLSLNNREYFSGELLSVRDSTIMVCAKYSATEEELANKKYSINSVPINQIRELKIEGNALPLWIGAGISLVASTAVYLIVKDDMNIKLGTSSEEEVDIAVGSCCLVGAVIALPMVIGRALFTEDALLTEIPAGYKFLPLKSLARYQDEEPEYLRVIN